MKIVFLCASLEAGRDGVGDYTRQLARECAARGHACLALALHDSHVTRETSGSDGDLPLLRLPATAPWPERVARATRYIQALAPDWVSWQFVAYGFNAQGRVPPALEQLAQNLSAFSCQVMLHELWIGLEQGATWRARFLGWRQRRRLLRLLEALRPHHLQTSNSVYQQALVREGHAASVLGLFGNVPITAAGPEADAALDHWLPSAAGTARASRLVAITFGTLHPQWRPHATVEWMIRTGQRLGRTPALLAVGRPGARATAMLNSFARRGVQIGATGVVDVGTVASLLRAADFGLAPHPWALIGKSGAAAAMLDHGLPVLVPRDDWHLRGADTPAATPGDPLLVRLAGLDDAGTDRWLAQRRAPWPALPRIANEFLQALAKPIRPPAFSRP